MTERLMAQRIEYALSSNVGSREINEDSAGAWGDGGNRLFCVADGLGGHGKGEIASGAVTELAGSLFAAAPTEPLLDDIFLKGQASLMKLQEEAHEYNSFKTTMSLLRFQGGQALWGHIGDSRIYRFIGGEYPVRTLDHSVPQMLVLAGEIKEKNIRGNSDRNRLLRVMGIDWDSPKYELCEQPQQLLEGDAFLICTDGFWEYIDEKRMTALLARSDSPQKWLDAMNAEVLKNGRGKDMDNFTAIAVICF